MKHINKNIWICLFALFLPQSAHPQILGNEFGYPVSPDSSTTDTRAVILAKEEFGQSATGGATYTIPIELPEGIPGMQPQVSLKYNSQSNYGLAGVGFSISGFSSITRGPRSVYFDRKARGISFDLDDALYLDGQRLIRKEYTEGTDSAVYCLESNVFTRVVAHGTDGQDQRSLTFLVTTADGMTCQYGGTDASSWFFDTSSGSYKAVSWGITYREDACGNRIDYEYTRSENHLYPHRISYGYNKRVQTSSKLHVCLEYENRPDARQFYMGSVAGFIKKRLSSVSILSGSQLLKSYVLSYNAPSGGIPVQPSRLSSVTERNGNSESAVPITLTWNVLPDFRAWAGTANLTEPTAVRTPLSVYGAADINGDGISDIFATVVNDMAGQGPYDFVNVYYSSRNGLGSVVYSQSVSYSLDNGTMIDDYRVRHNDPGVAMDLNDDGIAELVVPTRYSQDGVRYIEFRPLSGGGFLHGQKYYFRQDNFIYATDDFDNDGKGNIFLLETDPEGTSGRGAFMRPGSASTAPRYVNLFMPGKPKALYTADMNQDGMTDIVVCYSNSYFVYLNRGTWLDSVADLTLSADIAQSFPVTVSHAYMGDFNGDGCPDFLVTQPGNSQWCVIPTKGNGEPESAGVRYFQVDASGSASGDYDIVNCLVYDFNGDGFSDAVIKTWNNSLPVTYWMSSNGTTLVPERTATGTIPDALAHLHAMLGDFNGDGLLEMACVGEDCYEGSVYSTNPDQQTHIYYNEDYSPNSGKLSSVTSSSGRKVQMFYKSLAGENVYTYTHSVENSLCECLLPLHVLSTVVYDDGAAGQKRINYTYGGLKCGLTGKGIIGFSRMKRAGVFIGPSSGDGFSVEDLGSEETVTTWNAASCRPQTIVKTTRRGDESMSVERKLKTVTLNPGNSFPKEYVTRLDSVTETDFDGLVTTAAYQYGDSLRLLQSVVRVFPDWSEDHLYLSGYILRGNRYQPQTVTRRSYPSDDNASSPPYVKTTSLAYDACGLKTSVIENYGTSKPLTTTYEYDACGNVTKRVQTGSGLIARQTQFEYTADKRHLAARKDGQYTFNMHVVRYTYDLWGNRLTETDASITSRPQTTIYTYDGWGRQVLTTLPNGQRKRTSWGWGSSRAQRYYVLEQGTSVPWVKTWYDETGREVKSESIAAGDVYMCTTTSYDEYGRVSSREEQYGELTKTDTFSYDDRDRIVYNGSSTGKSRSYEYQLYWTTLTENDREYFRGVDDHGHTTLSCTPGSCVSCSYSSNGQPDRINVNEAHEVSFEYDDCANRTVLDDPDAGRTTYTHDALGRIRTKTDARGKTLSYSFDAFGAPLNAAGTSYSYANNSRLLTRLSASGGSVAFGYDNLNRLSQKTYSVYAGKRLTASYTYHYDAGGQVESISYPGNLTVHYGYDAYGNMTSMRIDNKTVWQLAASSGAMTTSSLGQYITRTDSTDVEGHVTRSRLLRSGESQPLADVSYGYDAVTGNLLSRVGLQGSESFEYDAEDRLTAARRNGAEQQIRYDDYGNIRYKTGIGRYVYDGTQRDAVTCVENTDGAIPTASQSTAFNDEGKIDEIIDGPYRLKFAYGPEGQRMAATFCSGLDTIQTMAYLDNVDVVIEGNTEYWYYYLGNGVVYYKCSDEEEGQVFYTFTDNLGSVTRIFDEEGTEVFSATYDAWGLQTVTKNQIGFIRGYTGHEMLPEFGLVNMNGRLYDPALGRFVSCDDYVQDPLNPHNYNRYSYCLNNPLKYTDPSGELIGIDDFIAVVFAGALIGSVTNLVANVDNISSAGDFFKYMSVGAISGAVGGAAAVGATLVGVGGVLGGMLAGGAGGIASGLVLGGGNAWIQGGNLNDILYGSFVGAAFGGAFGALAGGVTGGIYSYLHDENIWTGVPREINLDIAPIEPAEIGNIRSQELNLNGLEINYGEPIQKHHSFPKFMGGDPKQKLTPMTTSEHMQLHKDLNRFLYEQRDYSGIHHMRPQKNNSGNNIKYIFPTEERIDALKRFYDQNSQKYFNARRDFYINIGKYPFP